MNLIVGLGNPGTKHAKNRHNIGFIVLDNLDLEFKEETKFLGKIARKGQNIYLKPQTYMNLSGQSVKKVADFYQIPVSNIYVIHDDIDLEFGKIRIKKNSGHGGQNGIRNIIECFNNKDFQRIKIGIGRDPLINVANYVLGNFNDEQNATLPNIINEVKNIMNEMGIL